MPCRLDRPAESYSSTDRQAKSSRQSCRSIHKNWNFYIMPSCASHGNNAFRFSQWAPNLQENLEEDRKPLENLGITEKTGREPYAIAPTSSHKTVKIQKGLKKATSGLIVQMRIEKIVLRKFIHARKVREFESSECPYGRGPQTAKYILIVRRIYTRERDETWEKDRRFVRSHLSRSSSPYQ